jgi:hypothetical protein
VPTRSKYWIVENLQNQQLPAAAFILIMHFHMDDFANNTPSKRGTSIGVFELQDIQMLNQKPF